MTSKSKEAKQVIKKKKVGSDPKPEEVLVLSSDSSSSSSSSDLDPSSSGKEAINCADCSVALPFSELTECEECQDYFCENCSESGTCKSCNNADIDAPYQCFKCKKGLPEGFVTECDDCGEDFCVLCCDDKEGLCFSCSKTKTKEEREAYEADLCKVCKKDTPADDDQHCARCNDTVCKSTCYDVKFDGCKVCEKKQEKKESSSSSSSSSESEEDSNFHSFQFIGVMFEVDESPLVFYEVSPHDKATYLLLVKLFGSLKKKVIVDLVHTLSEMEKTARSSQTYDTHKTHLLSVSPDFPIASIDFDYYTTDVRAAIPKKLSSCCYHTLFLGAVG